MKLLLLSLFLSGCAVEYPLPGGGHITGGITTRDLKAIKELYLDQR